MRRFRRALLAAAAAIGFASIASASDTPVKASRPTVGAAPSWTGFYVGANGGWGWSKVTDLETSFGVTGIAGILPQSVGSNLDGGVFGGQIGYNWQTGNLVLGVEGDFDAASISGGSEVVFRGLGGAGGLATDGFMTRDKINWLASIRGRLGWTWGSGLIYATGGAAWETFKTTAMISTDTDPAVFSQSATGSFSSTRLGYVIGGGYEWMFAPKWSVRGEYLYYRFTGSSTNQINIPDCGAGPPCGVNVTTGSNNVNVFRLGLNYYIGGDDALSANASDMPVKASRPAVGAAPSWTGFYVGANGGWGWSKVTDSGDAVWCDRHCRHSAAVGWKQLGWRGFWWPDWLQLADRELALGVEGDFDAASISGGSEVVFRDLLGGAGGLATDGFMTRDKINWLASIRGRLGWTWGPGLIYATGGAAWENVKTTAMISTDTDPAVFSQSATGSFSNTRSGYVIGGGYEWMFAPKWSVRGEYLYYRFTGSSTNQINIPDCGAGPPCGVNVTTGSNNVNVFRLGLNYQLN